MTAPVCRVPGCADPTHAGPIRGVVVLEIELDQESQAPFEPVLHALHAADLPGVVALHAAIEHAAYGVVRLVATHPPHLPDYVRRVT